MFFWGLKSSLIFWLTVGWKHGCWLSVDEEFSHVIGPEIQLKVSGSRLFSVCCFYDGDVMKQKWRTLKLESFKENNEGKWIWIAFILLFMRSSPGVILLLQIKWSMPWNGMRDWLNRLAISSFKFPPIQISKSSSWLSTQGTIYVSFFWVSVSP